MVYTRPKRPNVLYDSQNRKASENHKIQNQGFKKTHPNFFSLEIFCQETTIV